MSQFGPALEAPAGLPLTRAVRKGLWAGSTQHSSFALGSTEDCLLMLTASITQHTAPGEQSCIHDHRSKTIGWAQDFCNTSEGPREILESIYVLELKDRKMLLI